MRCFAVTCSRGHNAQLPLSGLYTAARADVSACPVASLSRGVKHRRRKRRRTTKKEAKKI